MTPELDLLKRELYRLTEENRVLKKCLFDMQEIAKSWMKECDKLKEKYHPTAKAPSWPHTPW